MREFLNHYLQLKPDIKCEFFFESCVTESKTSYQCRVTFGTGESYCGIVMNAKDDAADSAALRAVEGLMVTTRHDIKIGEYDAVVQNFDEARNYIGLLQEYAQTQKISFPVYSHKTGGTKHVPMYCATCVFKAKSFVGGVFPTLKMSRHSAAHVCLLDLQDSGDLKGYVGKLAKSSLMHRFNNARTAQLDYERSFCEARDQEAVASYEKTISVVPIRDKSGRYEEFSGALKHRIVTPSDVNVDSLFMVDGFNSVSMKPLGGCADVPEFVPRKISVGRQFDGFISVADVDDELPIVTEEDNPRAYAVGDFDRDVDYLGFLRRVAVKRFNCLPEFHCTLLGTAQSSYCQVMLTLSDERLIENSEGIDTKIAMNRASWAFLKFFPTDELKSVIVPVIDLRVGVDYCPQYVAPVDVVARRSVISRVELGQSYIASLTPLKTVVDVSKKLWSRIVDYLPLIEIYKCRGISKLFYAWLDFELYWVSKMSISEKCRFYTNCASRPLLDKEFSLGFDYRAIHALFDTKIVNFYYNRMLALFRADDLKPEIIVSDIDNFKSGLIEENVCGVIIQRRGARLGVRYYDNDTDRAKFDTTRDYCNKTKPYVVSRSVMPGRCDNFWMNLACEATIRACLLQWFRTMGGANEVRYVRDPYTRRYCVLMLFVVPALNKFVEIGASAY